MLKVVVLVVFIRFSIPLMMFANDFVYNNFVKNEYSITKSEKELDSAKGAIEDFDDSKSSFFSTDYYKNRLKYFKTVVSKASDNIVDLLIVFVFQTIFFPIIFLFLLYKTTVRIVDI